MNNIKTKLGGIELNYEKGADFPLSIDGNLLYPSDINELYNFLDRVCKDEIIHDVILCDAPEKVLPCRHKCFSQCQLKGHCNYQKHEV